MINTREIKPLKSVNDDAETMSQQFKQNSGLQSSTSGVFLFLPFDLSHNLSLHTQDDLSITFLFASPHKEPLQAWVKHAQKIPSISVQVTPVQKLVAKKLFNF